MFNLGFTELILLGVIALVFIGPKQLPEVARTVGRLLNEWKRATSDFQSTFTTDITTDVTERWNERQQSQIPGVHEPGSEPATEMVDEAAVHAIADADHVHHHDDGDGGDGGEKKS